MLRTAIFPQDLLALRQLINEYVAWLNLDLAFQQLDDELAHLDTIYHSPQGHYILAEIDGQIAGGVGFKHKTSTIAEIKRLYVRPSFQGQGLGQTLMQTILTTLRQLGYQQALLDVSPKSEAAQKLYASMGFQPIAAYYYTPIAGTLFYQLNLNDYQASSVVTVKHN